MISIARVAHGREPQTILNAGLRLLPLFQYNGTQLFKAGLAELGNRYHFGVYGSRNVCTRVSEEVGARWSLVSGMSWGYSGNLGFPLPQNWSLNQIREYEFKPGWGLDHDVWRDNADPGVSALETGI